jgi:hypothetical protein
MSTIKDFIVQRKLGKCHLYPLNTKNTTVSVVVSEFVYLWLLDRRGIVQRGVSSREEI